MSTDSLRDSAGDVSKMVSWERWDRIKHTERFVVLASIVFVALFSYTFTHAPVISDVTQGYHDLAKTILMWSIFAFGFNLLLGQTGLLSFGHGLFWGTAGYGVALFGIHVVNQPSVMLLAGVVLALLFAFASAFILLRLESVYFAIVTLAIAQFVWALSREPLQPITRGINGLEIDPEPLFGVVDLYASHTGLFGQLFGDNFYILISVLFVATVAFITRLRKSPYGLIFKAIRENETRATFVGLDTWKYKFAAFVISAGIVGLGGALLAMDNYLAVTNRLYWQVSGNIVVVVVLGGLGTLVGPVIGAIVFNWFSGVVNAFPTLGEYWLLLLALAFTVVVWRYPDGIWGFVTNLTENLREPKQIPGKFKQYARGKVDAVTSTVGSSGGDR